MILNKFRPRSLFHLFKALSLQFLAISLFSCAKTANSNANKSFVALTHVAYGVGPLNLVLDGDSLLPAPVPFGNTSGTPGFPYDTTTSRIDDMQLVQGSDILLQGNSAFQQGVHYSIFAYDTLNKNTINLIIFQDNPTFRTDTFTYIRYLNFSPGSKALGLYLTNSKDTLLQFGPRLYVGNNKNPSAYGFTQVHIGYYGVRAYMDSINSAQSWPVDSLRIDTTKNYNVYLQGFVDSASGINKLHLKSVQLN